MAKFGYSLSSEQLNTSEILEFGKEAEELGFDFIMISDHFHPWIDEQGQSPFVWSMLGALSQVTKQIPIGTGVTGSILRIHPAIIAQAIATTSCLLEDRFIFGIGSGENLNEHVVGEGWPWVDVRHEMLREYLDIIYLLLQGGNQTYVGNYYTVEDARIYTLPKINPPIIISAYGPKAIDIAIEYGDGLITTTPDEELIKKYDKETESENPKFIQFSVCFDTDEEKALETAYKIWPISGLKDPLNTELRIPAYFEKASKMVKKEDLKNSIPYGPNPSKYIEEINKALDMGFTHIYLNQIGKNQKEFMNFYKNEIIPNIKS